MEGYDETDDLFASPAAGSEHNNIMLAASIEGGENSPPVSPDANNPGLNTESPAQGGSMSKWLWIALVALAALFLFWYMKPATSA